MDVRMRNAQKDPDGKPVGIRPLWRPMHKVWDNINYFHATSGIDWHGAHMLKLPELRRLGSVLIT
jgi:hypothetical protein